MRSVLPVTLGKDEATYVEYGFARFVDSETKTVAVDEPLVLLSATRWINANHRTSYKFFAKQIHLHEPSSNGFENYIAFCIDMMFSYKRRVNEVFQFNGIAPRWSSLEAELVSLYRTDLNIVEQNPVRHFLFQGPSVTLGVNAKSPEETSSWLGHRSHTPICFPHISMGPDLIFVLRLSDGSLIWVVLQAKYSLGKNGLLSRPFLRRAMRSVTPSSFFLDKVRLFLSTHPTNTQRPPNFIEILTDSRSICIAHIHLFTGWQKLLTCKPSKPRGRDKSPSPRAPKPPHRCGEIQPPPRCGLVPRRHQPQAMFRGGSRRGRPPYCKPQYDAGEANHATDFPRRLSAGAGRSFAEQWKAETRSGSCSWTWEAD